MDKLVINAAVYECHKLAYDAGWWDLEKLPGLKTLDPDVPKRLMLIVSELAEAMEADRKGLSDSHLTHREGVEVELADAVIRIFDLCGAMSLDLGGAIVEKLEYNKQRADHKPENRAKAGGKKY